MITCPKCGSGPWEIEELIEHMVHYHNIPREQVIERLKIIGLL